MCTNRQCEYLKWDSPNHSPESPESFPKFDSCDQATKNRPGSIQCRLIDESEDGYLCRKTVSQSARRLPVILLRRDTKNVIISPVRMSTSAHDTKRSVKIPQIRYSAISMKAGKVHRSYGKMVGKYPDKNLLGTYFLYGRVEMNSIHPWLNLCVEFTVHIFILKLRNSFIHFFAGVSRIGTLVAEINVICSFCFGFKSKEIQVAFIPKQ